MAEKEPRTLTIFETRYRIDDIVDGDIPNDDVREEVTTFGAYDTLDDVIRWLTDAGLTDYSSFPDWQPGGWYVDPDGSWPDYATGKECKPSGVLAGFEEWESRAIHAAVTGQPAILAEYGAALLDEKLPGWAADISLITLNIGDCWYCVLGQLFNDYSDGVDGLSIESPVAYGFAPPNLPGHMYGTYNDTLTEAWRAQVERRTAA